MTKQYKQFTDKQESLLLKEFDKIMKVGTRNIVLCQSTRTHDGYGLIDWWIVEAYSDLYNEGDLVGINVGIWLNDARKALVVL